MQPDDELCLCFHVSKRKLVNYLRIERPRRASELTGCFGAGTGCGWCRPFLEKLFEQARRSASATPDLPSRCEYAEARQQFIADGHGSPPS